MPYLRWVVFLLVTATFASPPRPPPSQTHHERPCRCFDFKIPLSFQALSLQPSFSPFKNQHESVAFLNQLSARRTANSMSPIKGAIPNQQIKATIAAKYCFPTRNDNGVLQILSHGLGFDSKYWSFGGEASEYNYIKAATEAGYATLSYDRIGNGKSTKTDPYTVSQQQIEVEILKIITDHLRSRDLLALRKTPIPKKIVHVGHSFGSVLSNALVARYPNASDGLVLTGYAMNATSAFVVSSNFHLARDMSGRQNRGLSTGYLTWGDELANQYSFLHWPNFDVEVLTQVEANKSPFAIGEILTLATEAAPEFHGPVLVISGAYDKVFCDSDCSGVLEQSAALFPQAKPFETYMQPNTAHGMNIHYNATGTYQVVNDFVARHVKA